ncbi:hypothetical protein BDR05DRAFT_996434 [Suillus weaverae]|nr:hypothetical protein BDR05DRAFT_996434 [Suillus weaverae]
MDHKNVETNNFELLGLKPEDVTGEPQRSHLTISGDSKRWNDPDGCHLSHARFELHDMWRASAHHINRVPPSTSTPIPQATSSSFKPKLTDLKLLHPARNALLLMSYTPCASRR